VRSECQRAVLDGERQDQGVGSGARPLAERSSPLSENIGEAVCYFDVDMRWEEALSRYLAVTLWVVRQPPDDGFRPCATMGMPCRNLQRHVLADGARPTRPQLMPLVATDS